MDVDTPEVNTPSNVNNDDNMSTYYMNDNIHIPHNYYPSLVNQSLNQYQQLQRETQTASNIFNNYNIYHPLITDSHTNYYPSNTNPSYSTMFVMDAQGVQDFRRPSPPPPTPTQIKIKKEQPKQSSQPSSLNINPMMIMDEAEILRELEIDSYFSSTNNNDKNIANATEDENEDLTIKIILEPNLFDSSIMHTEVIHPPRESGEERAFNIAVRAFSEPANGSPWNSIRSSMNSFIGFDDRPSINLFEPDLQHIANGSPLMNRFSNHQIEDHRWSADNIARYSETYDVRMSDSLNVPPMPDMMLSASPMIPIENNYHMQSHTNNYGNKNFGINSDPNLMYSNYGNSLIVDSNNELVMIMNTPQTIFQHQSNQIRLKQPMKNRKKKGGNRACHQCHQAKKKCVKLPGHPTGSCIACHKKRIICMSRIDGRIHNRVRRKPKQKQILKITGAGT